MSFLGFPSTRLELWSVLPKDTPTKNPQDPVRLKPRTPELWVEHWATQDPTRNKQCSGQHFLLLRIYYHKGFLSFQCFYANHFFMASNSILNLISVSRQPVHLSMLSWSGFYQCSVHYSLKATSCFITLILLKKFSEVRKEWILSQWLSLIGQKLFALGIEPATSVLKSFPTK